MTKKYFLPHIARPIESVKLGRFVPQVKQLDQDAFSYLEAKEGQDFFVTQQENLGEFLEVTNNTSFKTNVTRLLSAAFRKEESDNEWRGPCQVRCYRLKNPNEFFKKLITLEPTREWLQNRIEEGRDSVYFIVGYYTALDATVYRNVQHGSQASLQAQVPLGDILSGGASVPLSGIVDLDVGGAVAHSASYTQHNAARTSGERVYAYCHRKVKFRIFARDKIATARLNPDNSWNSTTDNRGDDDEEEEEVVEATLGEMEEDGEDGFEIQD